MMTTIILNVDEDSLMLLVDILREVDERLDKGLNDFLNDCEYKLQSIGLLDELMNKTNK